MPKLDNTTLAGLINANGAALAAKQIGNDSGCAAILNVKNQRGWVPVIEIEQYCLLQGISPVLNALSQDVTSPAYGIAWTALHYFTSSKYIKVDLDLTAVQMMLGGLELATIITTEQKNAILAMAENRWSVVEVAAYEDGYSVSADDITGVVL